MCNICFSNLGSKDVIMRTYKSTMLGLLAGISLLSGAAIGKEVVLEQVKAFPVAKELLTLTGEPVSVIDTGFITNESGEKARGPHEILFTLDNSAPYGVVVGGEEIAPGETKTIVRNLTTSGHKLLLPIYPAESGIEGVASYNLAIPEVKIVACQAGFTEMPDNCYKIEHSTIEYNCPSGSDYQTDTEDCRRIEETSVVEYCDAPFVKKDGVCVQEFTVAAGQACPTDAGWSKDGTICRYFDSQDIENCPTGYALENGECRTLTAKSQYCPPGYTNDGAGNCLKTESVSVNEICSDGFIIVGQSCSKLVTKPVIESCLDGYIKNEAGECLKTTVTDTVERCVKGYFNGSICEIIQGETAYQSQCAGLQYQPFNDGSGLGTCYRRYPAGVPVPTCSAGSTMIDGMCEKVEGTPLIVVCPDSYSLNTSLNQCESTLNEDITYSCDDGWNLSNDSCNRTLSEMVDYYCDSQKYEFNTTQCANKTQTNNIGSCSAGYSLNTSNGNCEEVAAQEVIWSCPEGAYTLNKPGCDYHEEKPVKATCTSAGAAIDGDGYICKELIVDDAEFVCEAGFVPVPSENRCTKESTVPFI
jgi:hypothetical protein